MTLEEVKLNTPALFLDHAEAIYDAMIIAERANSVENISERKGKSVPAKTMDGEEGVNPINDQSGESPMP